MGRPGYNARVLSLRKTKLGESDLVLDLLLQDGSLVRAIAKGACKPKNTFSARLDLFSVADCLLAPGRTFDIVSEARLIEAHMPLRTDIARMAAAAPVLDALARCAHEQLPVARLFDMACAVLDAQSAADVNVVPALSATFLLKLCALLGVRPHIATCLSCGAEVFTSASIQASVDFSFIDGGAYCRDCAGLTDHVRVEADTLRWADWLMHAPFADVVATPPSVSGAFSALQFCNRFYRENLEVNLKSLTYLFTSGLF